MATIKFNQNLFSLYTIPGLRLHKEAHTVNNLLMLVMLEELPSSDNEFIKAIGKVPFKTLYQFLSVKSQV